MGPMVDRYNENLLTIGDIGVVRIRQRLEGRLGKWLAAGIALTLVLKRAQPLEIELDGRAHRMWLLFVAAGGGRLWVQRRR